MKAKRFVGLFTRVTLFFYGRPSITFEKSDRRSSVLKIKVTLVNSPKKRLAIKIKHLAITFEIIYDFPIFLK